MTTRKLAPRPEDGSAAPNMALDEDLPSDVEPFSDEQLDEEAAQQKAEQDDADRQSRLGALASRLNTLFTEQVSLKQPLEERWLICLRQYNGQYDDDVLQRIREAGGSEAYVNITRVKCNAVEAREAEMVAPTEDRNWSIEPTPVPDLVKATKAATPSDNGGQARGVTEEVQKRADEAAATMREAQVRAEGMQTVMDDQMEEAGLNAVHRQVIHNKVVLGTGILKGPVIHARVKRSFKKTKQRDEKTGLEVEIWAEVIEEDLAPGAESVSPWDFFPDMRATSMDDCEFTFERHRYNRQTLAELEHLPGFSKAAIKAAIDAGPVAAMAGLVDQAVSDDLRNRRASSRFEVIEYQGPVEREDLEAAGYTVPATIGVGALQGVVWICNGQVLKASLTLMRESESVYDAVPFERDDTCLFGFGLPYRMRHSQAAGNAAWRMVLDNARNSVGPQVVFQKGKVKPTNGDKRVGPNKTWEVDEGVDVREAFGVFAISPNFKSMFDILQMVRQFADEETGMPAIAQGQQLPTITKTAEGMSILMNSANTVLRRIVKEYDDWITTRFIKRLYRWNMKFNEREDIKGDYTIKALGSAALLLAEQQSKGMMQLSQLAMANPEFSKRTKWGDLYRQLVKALRISADSLVMTEDEFAQEQQRQAQNGPQIAPEIQVKMAELQVAQGKLKLEEAREAATQQLKAAELQLKAREAAASDELERQRVAAQLQEARMRFSAAMASANAAARRDQLNYQAAVLRLIQDGRLSEQQAQQQYGLKAMDIDSKHQLFNAEMAHADQYGQGI
jgi:hypothetical protein